MPAKKRKLVGTELVWLETSVRSTHYPEILFNLSREDFYKKLLGPKHIKPRNQRNAEKAVDKVFSRAVQDTFRTPNQAVVAATKSVQPEHEITKIHTFTKITKRKSVDVPQERTVTYKISASKRTNINTWKVEIHSGSRVELMEFFKDYYAEDIKNGLSFQYITKIHDGRIATPRDSPLRRVPFPDVPDSGYGFFAAQVVASLLDTSQGGAMSCENLITVDDFAHVKDYLLGETTRSDLSRLSMTGAATGIFSIDDAAAEKCSALAKLFANLKHCAATVFGAVAGETSPADVSLAYCTLVCFDTVPYTHSHTVHTYSRMYTRTQNQIWSRVTQQIHTYTM
jgi:hypothetical protein